jgi:hypothetical protein
MWKLAYVCAFLLALIFPYGRLPAKISVCLFVCMFFSGQTSSKCLLRSTGWWTPYQCMYLVVSMLYSHDMCVLLLICVCTHTHTHTHKLVKIPDLLLALQSSTSSHYLIPDYLCKPVVAIQNNNSTYSEASLIHTSDIRFLTACSSSYGSNSAIVLQYTILLYVLLPLIYPVPSPFNCNFIQNGCMRISEVWP